MKVIVFSNHASCIPVLHYFYIKGWIKAVVTADGKSPSEKPIEDFCNLNTVRFVKIERLGLTNILPALFEDLMPDFVIMFGFPYRIPNFLYTHPRLGFYNVHFSMLPEYRGADPIFWQIKNGENSGGVSIHLVDGEFDNGPLVMQEPLVFIPGETSGISIGRHSQLALLMIQKLTNSLSERNRTPSLPGSSRISSYFPKANQHDIKINWALQGASEVEALVNACNPGAGGAVTFFRKQIVRILEVSPVDGTFNQEVVPGGVIHADQSGLYVKCFDHKLLRINILKLEEGFLTGSKLTALGVKVGDKFEDADPEYKQLNH
ncbi:methionyl-tRNA formyltransferase [Pedobacter agri]|uniref:methionyl-tRNA formyltransferase n=1 Tax=Pedobacter agri TaxID=454586 RepID=UPI00292DC17C|nr:formyltransferase family protein [Pedobacter agri]